MTNGETDRLPWENIGGALKQNYESLMSWNPLSCGAHVVCKQKLNCCAIQVHIAAMFFIVPENHRVLVSAINRWCHSDSIVITCQNSPLDLRGQMFPGRREPAMCWVSQEGKSRLHNPGGSGIIAHAELYLSLGDRRPGRKLWKKTTHELKRKSFVKSFRVWITFTDLFCSCIHSSNQLKFHSRIAVVCCVHS